MDNYEVEEFVQWLGLQGYKIQGNSDPVPFRTVLKEYADHQEVLLAESRRKRREAKLAVALCNCDCCKKRGMTFR